MSYEAPLSTPRTQVQDISKERPHYLTALPQELLTHIAEHLPSALDVFSLRGTCRTLYHRLGQGNLTLWIHFLEKSREYEAQSHTDPFNRVIDILSGRQDGCGVCLRIRTPPIPDQVVDYESDESLVIRHRSQIFPVYRGGIFYRTMCRRCIASSSSTYSKITAENPLIKFDPNILLLWSDENYWDDEVGGENDYFTHVFALPRDCHQILLRQKQSGRSSAAEHSILDSILDIRIHRATAFKAAADIVIQTLVEAYKDQWQLLHEIMPLEDFERGCFRASWKHLGSTAILSPTSFKQIPRTRRFHKIEDLFQEYIESDGLSPVLRLRNLRDVCRELLDKFFTAIPYVPRDGAEARCRLHPFLRAWFDAYLSRWCRSQTDRVKVLAFRNIYNIANGRTCPYCPERIDSTNERTPVSRLARTHTDFISHIWHSHPEKAARVIEWLREDAEQVENSEEELRHINALPQSYGEWILD